MRTLLTFLVFAFSLSSVSYGQIGNDYICEDLNSEYRLVLKDALTVGYLYVAADDESYDFECIPDGYNCAEPQVFSDEGVGYRVELNGFLAILYYGSFGDISGYKNSLVCNWGED